jgi:NADH:ubiquinone reductase (non-electrogenic)
VQVKAVEPNLLVLVDKKTGEERRIDFGICVWCTGASTRNGVQARSHSRPVLCAGIKMNPLCERLIKDLPEGAQPNFRSLTTDTVLRVKARAGDSLSRAVCLVLTPFPGAQGSGGSIFALGDCATIELKTAASHAERMLSSDSPALDRTSLEALLRKYSEEFPHLKEAADRVDQEFEEHSVDGGLRTPELAKLLSDMDRGLRTLPATAQVAKQEGEYVASLFGSTNRDLSALCTGDQEAFSYKHKGSLAYIGADAAVADIPGFAILRGVFAGLVWKSFETWSQVSVRNQALVFADLLRTKIFGRDLSRV